MKDLVPQKLLDFSRQLRTKQTPWETKLWSRLRAGRFYGLKFKRQQLIDNKYIVDFYCQGKKLVIELDGGQHSESKQTDFERDKYLVSKGYTVLRFWNNEIDQSLYEILNKIKEAARV